MTDRDQQYRWDDAHALSGAYAVDALDDVERARFEAHLRVCADCRAEVDGLREAASLLGIADEAAPPASVRDAVLTGITAIRPLPPVADEAPSPVAPAPSAPTDELTGRRRGLLRRLPLMVAAAAVVLLGLGLAVVRPWAGDVTDAPQLTAAERVLGAEDAQTFEKRFPDGSQARVVLSRSEGRAVIITRGMAPAPTGKVYELWLQTPAGEMQAAGLMPDTRNATVLLEGDASRATGVGITVEPRGGSERPTSDPIAVFNLEA